MLEALLAEKEKQTQKSVNESDHESDEEIKVNEAKEDDNQELAWLQVRQE